MQEKYRDEILHLLRSMQNIDYIRPGEVPNIDLYMDQVTTFMDEHLSSSKRFAEDKILTKTMINNYTKNNLLPPPEKKKYSSEHMLLLIYIYYFKNFLSISDIHQILEPLSNRFFHLDNGISLEEIYDKIVSLEKGNINAQIRDIIKKLQISGEAFEDVENPEDAKMLSTFAFICMLSFDVWVKKSIIENLIDEQLAPANENKSKSAPKEKAASKQKSTVKTADKSTTKTKKSSYAKAKETASNQTKK